MAREFPLIVTTGGRVPYFFLTQHRQIPRLRKQHPFPLVQIHPKTAARLGLAEGDWAWIESPRGRCDEPPFLDIGFGGCNLRGFLAKVYKAGK